MDAHGDTFEDVDWSDTSSKGLGLSRATLGFLVTLVPIVAAYAYDYTQVPSGEKLLPKWHALGLPGWNVTGIDWLFMVSLSALVWFLCYPLATTPGLARRHWRRLRENRRGVVALGILVAFYLVGIFGPFALDLLREFTGITGARSPRGIAPLQPPYGVSVSMATTNNICVGKVTDGMCHGTIYHPFGTNENLDDMLVATVEGAQTALQVATVVAVIAAPIGVLVGVVTAQFGGRVDELLMRYVDIQLVVPPFLIYIFLQVILGRGLVLLVVIFGLLDWGSVARLVRSDALSKAEQGFVLAAEDAGSGSLRTMRKHLLPNVASTAITGITLMMPTVILVEVTLAFLGFGEPRITSWGNLISGASIFTGAILVDGFDPDTWWTELIPVVALAVTVFAFNAFGDAMRDVLDPKTEGGR